MARLSILGVILLAALAAAQNRTSSTTSTTNIPPRPSIIYGSPAAEGEIPFQAALFSPITGRADGAGKLCGASLIRSNWVLTAAHCLTDTDSTTVGLGGVNRNSMPYSEVSHERFVHEGYDGGGNDIALIKLPSNAQGEFIEVVATAASGSFVDTPVRSSGFGQTESGQTSDILLKVNLQTISNQECVQHYGSRSITDSIICAEWVMREGESPCSGDSGGPLSTVIEGQDVVIGVAAFVHASGCDSGIPAAFTRVASYQDWIQRTIDANP